MAIEEIKRDLRDKEEKEKKSISLRSLAAGRKAFQRPMKDGVNILNAIQDVYLDSSITIA